MQPAPEQETDEEAEERKQQYEQQQSEYREMQERRAEERRQEEEQREQEYEAEQARREELRQTRQATFERILANAPANFSAAQLRMLLRAFVNLDPYTFADDVAEEIAGEDENEKRTAEEVLLAAIDGLGDEKLTGLPCVWPSHRMSLSRVRGRWNCWRRRRSPSCNRHPRRPAARRPERQLQSRPTPRSPQRRRRPQPNP